MTELNTARRSIGEPSTSYATPQSCIFLPRSHSEPMIDFQRTVFVRFRSLREPKRKPKSSNGRHASLTKTMENFRVSTFSIPSSDDLRIAKRRCIRKKAKKRIQKQLSSSSSDCSPTPYNRLLMDNDVCRFPSPPPTSETTIYPETPMDHRETKSPSQLLHLNGNHAPSLLAASSMGSFGDPIYDHDDAAIDEEIEKLREVARRINEKSQIERLRLQSTSSEGIEHLPSTWADNINYTEDIEEFLQSNVPINPFSDPFEDHLSERRSRTEMWVESTSPGVLESDSEDEIMEAEDNSIMILPNELPATHHPGVPLVPQVTVDACSESGEAPSIDSIPLPNFPVSITVNGEMLKDHSRAHIERGDSLQTDISETSYISSEMDRTSLAQLKFRVNLDKATEKQFEEIDISQVDRFWTYLYDPETKEPEEKQKERERKESMRRCHTPTVDRVVLYYTSDRRPSMTPTLTPSLPPPSPSIFSASSPALSGQFFHLSADSANNLFKPSPSPVTPITDRSMRSTRSTIPERSESLDSKYENELAMGSDGSEDQVKPKEEAMKTPEIILPSWKQSIYTVEKTSGAKDLIVQSTNRDDTSSVELPRDIEEIMIEVPTFLPIRKTPEKPVHEEARPLHYFEAPTIQPKEKFHQEPVPRQYVEVPERPRANTSPQSSVVQKLYNEVPEELRRSAEKLEEDGSVQIPNCAQNLTEEELQTLLEQQTNVVIYFSNEESMNEINEVVKLMNKDSPNQMDQESSSGDGRIYLLGKEQQFGSFERDYNDLESKENIPDSAKVSLEAEKERLLREAMEETDGSDDGLELPVNQLVSQFFHLDECSSGSDSEDEGKVESEQEEDGIQEFMPRRPSVATVVSPSLQQRRISRSTSTSDLLEVDEPSTSDSGSGLGAVLERDEPIASRSDNGLINTATNSSDSVGSQDNFSPQSEEHHSLLRDYRSPIPSFYAKSSQKPQGSSVVPKGRGHHADAGGGLKTINPERPAQLPSGTQHTSKHPASSSPVTRRATGTSRTINPDIRTASRSQGSLRNRRRIIRIPSSTRSRSLNSYTGLRRTGLIEEGVLYMALSDCENHPTLVVIDDDTAAPDTEVSLGGLLADKTLEDLEMSSTEDLLNLDASRPCSSGRKSVTFSDFINVEVISPKQVRRVSSDSHNYLLVKPILKKDDKTRETMRKMIDYARDRLYKDLRMLVEERDRAVHAIQLTSTSSNNLTAQTGFYQTRYREKLHDNKFSLDTRIEQVWQKLKELPLEELQAQFVFSVQESESLTLNSRRRVLPRRYTSYYMIERKENKYGDLELASDYAVKLQKLRGNLIRRESEIRRDDERSVEDIVTRISRAMHSYNKC